MRLFLGVDPGPVSCGVVLYDAAERRVVEAHGAMSVEAVIESIQLGNGIGATVAIERVTPGRHSSDDYLLTSLVVGRVYQRALDMGRRAVLFRRAEIVRHLGAGGPGSDDARVRAAMIDLHGPSRCEAVGTKKAPGPLYGVASHAWQALAVAYVAAQTVPLRIEWEP